MLKPSLSAAIGWSRSEYGVVSLLVATGLAFRLYGLNHDLPYLYDVDEQLFVQTTVDMLQGRDPNPHWFGAPGSTMFYCLAILYVLIFAVGSLFGVVHGQEHFRQLYKTDPTLFYLTGRLLSVAFAVASIALVYFIGRRLLGRSVGIVAALVLAVSPIHVALSQYVRMDTQVTFFLLLAFWHCLNILERENKIRSYVLAGLFTGLAVVTKYPAVVFVSVIIAAHLLTRPRSLKAHMGLVVSGASTLAGAFLGAPFVFLDFRTVLANVAQESRLVHLSATGEGLLPNLVWYLNGPLSDTLGILGLLLAAVGIPYLLFSSAVTRKLTPVFPLLFILFISNLHLRWDRWLVPAIPFAALLVAAGLWALRDKLLSLRGPRESSLLMFFATGVIVLPLAGSSWSHDREFARPNTITVAQDWFIANAPEGARVLVERYCPELSATRYRLYSVEVNKEMTPVSPSQLTAVGTFRPRGDLGLIRSTDAVRAEGIDFVIMSDLHDRYEKDRTYPEVVAKYDAIIGMGTLVFEVVPKRGELGGPRMRIYRMARGG